MRYRIIKKDNGYIPQYNFWGWWSNFPAAWGYACFFTQEDAHRFLNRKINKPKTTVVWSSDDSK